MKDNVKKSTLLSLFLLLLTVACERAQSSNDWTEPASPASENSQLPRLFTDNTGELFMSWIEENDGLSELKYARYVQGNWTGITSIAQDSGWFINWADFPSIIAHEGNPVAAHWLNKRPGGTYAYDVNIAAFKDDWSAPITPHNDNTATEHGFVSMVPLSDSTFFSVWLDGRQTDGRGHDDYSNIEQAMTLRGALIDHDTNILEEYRIDSSVCDCCNTALTQTDKGLIVAYRDRTDSEIRDIYTSRFQDGSWTDPSRVHADNWEIAACPVNGPAIDAHANHVALSWFTGARGIPKVNLALSDDYGDSYHSYITLDSLNTSGRTDLNMTDQGIWVSWLGETDDQPSLNIRFYDFEGNMKDEYRIRDLSSQRSAGFPQISPTPSGLMVAYTEFSDQGSTITTKHLNRP